MGPIIGFTMSNAWRVVGVLADSPNILFSPRRVHAGRRGYELRGDDEGPYRRP
jgi:hypothetical protein